MAKGDSKGSGQSGSSGGPGKDDLDNRSRQLNPEHDAFHQSRGMPGRPDGQKQSDS